MTALGLSTTLLLFVVSFNSAFAQTKVGVSVEQISGHPGAYDVTYVPPPTSVYGTSASEDTIFCAAIVGTMYGERVFVLPMSRLDTALYRTRLDLPDSTYTVRIEICRPTERLPEGRMTFAYQSEDHPLFPSTAMDILDNPDAALEFERTVYPWNFYAYYQHWLKSRNTLVERRGGTFSASVAALVDSMVQVLHAVRTPTFNWYLTVALFHGDRVGGDTLEHPYLDSAVQAQLLSRAHEPLLENSDLWGRAFAPELLEDNDIEMQDGRTAHLLDLAAAYPRSELGKTWASSASGFSGLDTNKVNTIFNAWATCHDAHLLTAIGSHLMIKESPLYNPIRAEQYFKRAETASAQQLGFRSGENIYGSMGRLDGIRASIIESYSAQGRHAEAMAFGEQSMRIAQNGDGRQTISRAQVQAAKAAGDTVLAERYKKYELPVVKDFAYEAMDGSKGRLADLKGKVIVLDFWFVGCAGCIIEHESLNEFGIRYQNDTRVMFLSIARDRKASVEKYLARYPLTATVIPNGKALCEAAGVTAFPTHIIIDQTGKTQLWSVGGSESSGDELTKVVSGLLE